MKLALVHFFILFFTYIATGYSEVHECTLKLKDHSLNFVIDLDNHNAVFIDGTEEFNLPLVDIQISTTRPPEMIYIFKTTELESTQLSIQYNSTLNDIVNISENEQSNSENLEDKIFCSSN
ncbi:MAG: hypothetical protein H6621_09255 [Halobacteriovoraceae bacterium]|nr:hypothetical protein [Halobacteriovoraceae bacterium]MCB9095242.1 hypothetical protein [Halobacteriovoraceae bacterium]